MAPQKQLNEPKQNLIIRFFPKQLNLTRITQRGHIMVCYRVRLAEITESTAEVTKWRLTGDEEEKDWQVEEGQ